MLETSEVSEIVRQVAMQHIVPNGVERVITEPAVDSTGGDAFQIIVVLTDEAVKALTGDDSLDLLVGVRKRLFEQGDERLPILGYATEKELLEVDDE